MNRPLAISVHFLFALSAAACSVGPKQFGSVCDGPSAPPVCDQSCNPAPGAATGCPTGFHCSPDATCDAQCTLGGSQCGAGYACSDDGRCIDDGSGPGGGPDANCPAVNFTATPVIPSISLLIDRSQSMGSTIGGKSRYQAIRDALVDPNNGVVKGLERKALFGASLYSSDFPCPRLYSVPRALNNTTAIATLIDSQTPDGVTPTGPSIDQAVAAFAASPPPAGSPPIIVLATDGEPNTCESNVTNRQPSINAARASFAAGIRLFVLGVSSDVNPSHLQDVANAGAGIQPGQPNAPFFVATTPQNMKTAFDQIIGGVTSCELTINGTVSESQAASGTVLVNGVPITFGTDWQLVNGNTIRILGQACTNLRNSPNPMVTGTFPCGTVIL